MRQINPQSKSAAPPRENLFRALTPGFEIRAADGSDRPVLVGHFAVFDQWTEINSIFEGNFLERIAPGSFTKTFDESRDSMQVLFQHGRDPVLGDQVLGTIEELREDEVGAYHEVSLFEGIPPLIMSGLRAGKYGESFRFRVMREEFVENPEPSAYNPKGIPERTIKEAAVAEFGPVTFPAYPGASAGIRSITDEIMFGRLVDSDPERLLQLVEFARTKHEVVEDAPSTPEAGQEPTSEPERRVAVTRVRRPIDYLAGEETWKI
jgi:HK97 family phage prohead protease